MRIQVSLYSSRNPVPLKCQYSLTDLLVRRPSPAATEFICIHSINTYWAYYVTSLKNKTKPYLEKNVKYVNTLSKRQELCEN